VINHVLSHYNDNLLILKNCHIVLIVSMWVKQLITAADSCFCDLVLYVNFISSY